ncbi:uncharacterized protein LOC105701726 isoform X2 [Orussus abietinus]|nr:uncharacterized protein LOC105701726 isoform X2 [Orussus abietinus]XP_012284151.1 uncharacterized protein LOC105701726 isoform X2 [Orussus abietinus]XP_012284152.1 uncharacterized protein LOC105701726 isoform X2 [Orussus abietinus]XP_012284153.1 uncharacterized protein LOC105701726 isoform X2 [Orussus abietinus]XP_012284154.1 uncharacterized protein LOC105701726 isoform X2 [Orussus abietinus]
MWSVDVYGISSTIYSESKETENCTIGIKNSSKCSCVDCTDTRCTVCCLSPEVQCCYCHTCSICRETEWQILTVAQVGLSSVLLISVIAILLLLFRICIRFIRKLRAERSASLLRVGQDGNTSVTSMQRYILERLRDRPPRYMDIYDPPPPYDADTDSYQSVTFEAPPMYPGIQDTSDIAVISAATRTCSSEEANHSRQYRVVNHI